MPSPEVKVLIPLGLSPRKVGSALWPRVYADTSRPMPDSKDDLYLAQAVTLSFLEKTFLSLLA